MTGAAGTLSPEELGEVVRRCGRQVEGSLDDLAGLQ